MITIPEKTVAVIDQMDMGMDILGTVYCSLLSEQNLDNEDLELIRHTLFHAIGVLKPVQQAVNKAHGAGLI